MKKKNKIEYYKVPNDIAELAERRTKELVGVWGRNPRNTLCQLAVSLYLQGLEDAVYVIYKNEASNNRI